MNKIQKQVLALSWVTYATFYFLRVNFSIAIPGIMSEFSLSRTEIGVALSAFFTMYAIGQFLSGQLADNLGPKRLLVIGLFSSIIINFLIPSFGGVVALVTILWGLNGVFQSMGWSPSVKIIASWFKNGKGKAAGILGTSYIVGGALSWLFAGYIAQFGWRYVFYAPLIIAGIVLFNWIMFAKENPEGEKVTFNLKETVLPVIKDKRVWFAGLGLFGLNIVRYGFMDWAPTYFFEVEKATITVATYKALVFPLAGAVGALSTGWLTDNIFKKRKTILGLAITVILAVSIVAFANTSTWQIGLVLLAIIGFTTFGPHMLLVTQLPMIFGNRKNVASITGLIDGIGYIGASLTGVLTAVLTDAYGWNYAFYFWVLGALFAGIFIYMSDRKL